MQKIIIEIEGKVPEELFEVLARHKLHYWCISEKKEVVKDMSNTLREYPTIPEHKEYGASKNMTVTATVQGKSGKGVQFTIGMNYVVLAQNQVEDLIYTLKKRVVCAKGYSGTDVNGDVIVVKPEAIKT